MDSSMSEKETLQDCEKGEPKTGLDSLPAKSKEKYLKAYELFMEWRATVGAKDFSEPVLLAYFKELAKTKQPSTLWVTYSMLRATVSANNNVHINGYHNVLLFLKSQAKGHESKKSKVFTAQDVETFLAEAPDETYLDVKVALIFGISGACRAIELLKIRPEDILKHSDQAMVVNLCTTGSPPKIERSFVIRDEYIKIVEKYQALRPPDMELDRFFINYQHGKCTRQAIGKHKFSEFPKRIAQFLNLPNPELYTGHCLRRTSALLLAQSGADAVLLKQFGGWKSTNSVVGFLEGTYIKRVRIDAPRIRALPTENLQNESPLGETQHFDSALNETQHFDSTLNETQHFDSTLNETQHFESTINNTQPFESTINNTQPFNSTINETQQFQSTINNSQHFEMTINNTKPFESTLNNTQPFESTLNNTQPFNPTINEPQHFESTIKESQPLKSILHNTQQTQTQWNDTSNTQQGNQWNGPLNNQQVIQQGTQLETESIKTQQDSNGTPAQLNECVDDSRSVKTDGDDPFDLIPDKYVMPPSPRQSTAATQPPPTRGHPSSPFRQLAAVDRCRLRLDKVRARQLHTRETRRLRVEARRKEVDKERSEALKRIAEVGQLWLDMLSQP